MTACSTDRRGLMKPSGRQDGLYRPAYAAPEMQDGSLRAPLLPATDLYGLCATLHHAIAGRAPPSWMERLCGEPSLSSLAPAGYPPALLALIDQGMAARPADRFASADAWWTAARAHLEALSGAATAAPSERRRSPLPPPRRGRPRRGRPQPPAGSSRRCGSPLSASLGSAFLPSAFPRSAP